MNTMPGMDILQQWMQSARGAIPGFQTWASPTLDPEEIGKRIEELRTVQFWLEQNARLIGTSIQALEVQRMTLSTLKSLKVPLADIGAAFRLPEVPTNAAPEPAAAPAAASAPAPASQPEPETTRPAMAAGSESAEPGVALADPMKWWGNLTQQFATLASQAVKDGAAAAAAAAVPAPSAKAATKRAPKAGKGSVAAKKTAARTRTPVKRG